MCRCFLVSALNCYPGEETVVPFIVQQSSFSWSRVCLNYDVMFWHNAFYRCSAYQCLCMSAWYRQMHSPLRQRIILPLIQIAKQHQTKTKQLRSWYTQEMTMNLRLNTPNLVQEFSFSYHVYNWIRQKQNLRHPSVSSADRKPLSSLFGTQTDTFLSWKKKKSCC